MADDFVRYPASARTNNPDKLARIRQRTADGAWSLLPAESWWRDHCQLLESHGYLLRPRFRPGWIPTWNGTNIVPAFCEDSILHTHRIGIDAQRLSDGKTVFVKRVSKGSQEVKIAQFLTSGQLAHNPHNHCVPILDHFMDNSTDRFAFVAMPLLRPFNDPPISFVCEVIDFFNQTLEGLVFIHEQGVAHRDLSDLNIMLDGTPLYPEGFHPTAQTLLPSGQEDARYLRRIDVPSVRYYITDFGISTQFEDPNAPRLVTGMDAQDKDVPELSDEIPYDPFLVDIFSLGSVYKRHFLDVYTNLSFLKPLVDAMVQRDPKARPTASEALSRFQTILSRQRGSALRWHLTLPNETVGRRMSLGVRSVAREVLFVMKKIATSPFVLATVFISAPGALLSALYGRQSFFNRLRNVFGRSPQSQASPLP